MGETDGAVIVADEPSVAAETASRLEAALPVTCVTVETPSALRAELDGDRAECVVTEFVFDSSPDDGTTEDGATLLEDLQWDDPTLPVVVFTDADVSAVVNEPVLAGATAYVDKRDTRATEELAGWVERAVARGEPARRKRITGIAHDLKNPIQAANVYLDALGRESESQFVDELAATHEHIHALADDLDDLVTAGTTVTDPVSIDVETAVDDAWSAVDTGSATLRLEAEGSIDGDPRKLFRLFENLFANAVDHGGDDVTVTVGRLDDAVADGDTPSNDAGDADGAAGGTAHSQEDLGQRGFYVADDGPGIPVEDRQSVFERGFTTSERGTGYGLAIVAELAAAHGWCATATESESGGARIEFRPE